MSAKASMRPDRPKPRKRGSSGHFLPPAGRARDAGVEVAVAAAPGEVGSAATGVALDAPGADFRERTVRTTVRRQPQTDGTAVAMNLALHRLASMHQHLSEATIHRPRGWTYSGFRVLYMVWLFEPIEARDLTRFAGVSRQTTSTVLATLESAGLVDRQREIGSDRRLVSVRLTERGRELIEAAIHDQNALERRWFTALAPAEQHAFIQMCDRIMLRMYTQQTAGGDADLDAEQDG